jgi:hypothetical protein
LSVLGTLGTSFVCARPDLKGLAQSYFKR